MKKQLKFRSVWKVVLWVMACLMVTPVCVLVLLSFDSFSSAWDFSFGRYGWDTLVLVVVAPCVSLVFALPQAFVKSHFEYPFRRVLGFFALSPLAFSPHVMALCYKELFEFGGLVWRLLGMEEYYIDFMNEYAAAFVFGMVLSPYVYLGASASFSWSLQYSEAASSLGVKIGWRYFVSVAMRLAWPYVLVSLILVALEAVNTYSVAQYFGLETYGVAFYRAWVMHGDLDLAMRMAFVFLVVMLCCVVPLRWMNERQKSMGKPKGTRLWKMSSLGRCVSYVVIGVPIVLGFVLPVMQLLYWVSVSDVSLMPSLEVFYASFELGVMVSVFGFLLGLILILGLVCIPELRGPKLLNGVLLFYYATPSIVIALPFFYVDYEGVGLLAMVLVLKFLPLQSFLMETQVRTIGRSVFLSARTLGDGGVRSFVRVAVPLLVPAFMAGGIFSFVEVVKELPVTLIMSPWNFSTLSSKTFQLIYEGRLVESAWPALGMIGIGFLGILCVYVSSERLTSYYVYARGKDSVVFEG